MIPVSKVKHSMIFQNTPDIMPTPKTTPIPIIRPRIILQDTRTIRPSPKKRQRYFSEYSYYKT